MIKYIPIRKSVSASLKDEQIFNSFDELRQHLVQKWAIISAYIGIPFTQGDVIVGEDTGDDPIYCMKKVRNIYIKRGSYIFPIGYCGE